MALAGQPGIIDRGSKRAASFAVFGFLIFRSSVARLLARESTSSSAKKHELDRFKHNHGVQPPRLVLDVVEIVSQLFGCIIQRCSVGKSNLRPASQTGSHEMTLGIVRNLGSQLAYEFRTLGPRPDEIHIAPHDVDTLWQLIKPQLSDDPAYPGYPGVSHARPDSARLLLSQGVHRPELDDLE